jgi:protein pelota
MKIIKSNVKKNFVKLEVNTLDDLWVLYNIISKGDVISGKTYRKIEYTSEKEKKLVFLKIETEKIEFHKSSNALRISGTIVESRMDEIPSGSHHTFTIQPGSLIKIEKEWKKFEIERLKQAVADTLKPKVLLAVFEPGQADFALLRGYGLDHVGSLNEVIPGKKEIKEREKSTEKFHDDFAKALEQLSSSNKIDRIIIGSIGIYNEDFADSLEEKDIKDKILFCKVSTIGKTGLNEMVKSGAIKKIVKDERVSRETELVEKILELIGKDGLVAYGLKEAEKAIEYGAVETLLITDKLISKFKQEDKFDTLDKIMSSTEKIKGKIEIISSEHEGGKKLDNLGGIAAILRYKIS